MNKHKRAFTSHTVYYFCRPSTFLHTHHHHASTQFASVVAIRNGVLCKTISTIAAASARTLKSSTRKIQLNGRDATTNIPLSIAIYIVLHVARCTVIHSSPGHCADAVCRVCEVRDCILKFRSAFRVMATFLNL